MEIQEVERLRLGVQHVMIEQIEPHPDNPRKTFRDDSLQELADSIRSVGVLQPPIVVPVDDAGARVRYRIVCGERRWRAATLAGLGTMPVDVRELSRQQQLEIMAVENLQREGIDPLEEARGFQTLLTEADWTQERLAEKLGKSQAYVANRLRLLRLPDEVQETISREMIPAAVALSLVKVAQWPELCLEAANEIVETNATSRSAPDIVDQVIRRRGALVQSGWNRLVDEYIEPAIAAGVRERIKDHPAAVTVKPLASMYESEPVVVALDPDVWRQAYNEAKAEFEATKAAEEEQPDPEEERRRSEALAEFERERKEAQIESVRRKAILDAYVEAFGAHMEDRTVWVMLAVNAARYSSDIAKRRKLYRLAGMEIPAEDELKGLGWPGDEARRALVEGLMNAPIEHLRQFWLASQIASVFSGLNDERFAFAALPDRMRARVYDAETEARRKAFGEAVPEGRIEGVPVK